jgi:MFS family permease
MFMDISSEMIHSVLPLFLVAALHSNVMFVGLIEGVAEATALITKTFSGFLSDRFGKRKIFALAGYGLGTLTKPLFAMAPGVGLVFIARFLDRIGKGIRGAPRDALMADITPPEIRGAAFGLRQSLDTAGAFMGPLLAVLLMTLTGNHFRFVFWVAVIPGLLAVSILALGVKEPVTEGSASPRPPIRFRDLKQFQFPYWLVVGFGTVFTLARFSEAFLLLRAQSVGMRENWVPLIMVIMNIFYFLTAYPVGHLSDRLGRTSLMAAGLVALIVSDFTLAVSSGVSMVAAGSALWGIHMGLTQGLLSALVADTSPRELRGTAFGVFSMAGGLAMLLASLIAGALWDAIGAQATFLVGAGFAALALLGYLPLRRWIKHSEV